MKKIIGGMLAVMLLFSGCQQEGTTPKKIVTGGSGGPGTVVVATSSASGTGASTPEAVTSEAASQLPISEDEEKLLRQFADDIANPAFRLTAESPETREVLFQSVKTDGDFGVQIAKILLENAVTASSDIPGSSRSLSLQAETGNLLEHAVFHQVPATDSESAGMMILELDMDGVPAVFAYDGTVFEQIDAIYKAQTQGVKTEFTGNATLIPSSFDLAKLRDDRGYETREFLQFGTRVLWRFVPKTDGYLQPSTIEMLDTVTGRSIYTSTISENVLRMEKFDGEAGFDYRIITPTGILYRSSGDRAREKTWRLPGTVSLFAANETLSGTFDMQYNQLAYADQDGIYLADQDGGNAQLLLSHSVLPEIMRSAAAAGFTYYFNDPHFLMSGTKLVTAIVSPQTGTRRLGFAVTDLDTMETGYFTGVTAADSQSVRYLSDQIISAQDDGNINLINAKNNDRGALPLNGLEGSTYLTYDCNVFAVWEPKISGTSAHSSSTYLCSNTNMMDRSKRLLDTYGGKYTPLAMTEEYLVGLNEDSRGLWFAISRYKTLPKSSNSSAASSKASTSSVDEETDSGSDGSTSDDSTSDDVDSSDGDRLPPDITPEL